MKCFVELKLQPSKHFIKYVIISKGYKTASGEQNQADVDLCAMNDAQNIFITYYICTNCNIVMLQWNNCYTEQIVTLIKTTHIR